MRLQYVPANWPSQSSPQQPLTLGIPDKITAFAHRLQHFSCQKAGGTCLLKQALLKRRRQVVRLQARY